MTHHPYTDTDLRTEAAAQLHTIGASPDIDAVGQTMDTRSNTPTNGPTWHHLNERHFDKALQQVRDLITGAADLSAWAVNLGADHLEPDPHVIDLDDNGQPTVRVHFAFHPDMTDTERHHLLTAASRALQTAADESR